jgi:hypothetical protein
MTVTLPACNPYSNRSGEFYAGPIDPVNFPIQSANCDCTSVPLNQGDAVNSNCVPFTDELGLPLETPTAACRPYQGLGFQYQFQYGTVMASTAWVRGQQVAYYAFPAPLGNLLDSYTNVVGGTRSRRPLVYVFDGAVGRESTQCTTPTRDYVFDQQRDYIRFDQQATVFGQKQTPSGYPGPALPEEDQRYAFGLSGVPDDALVDILSPPGALNSVYLPAYAEVAVTSDGLECQSLKSSEGIVTSDKVKLATDPRPATSSDANLFATGKPTGKYLAYALLDPVADVRAPNFTPAYGLPGEPADPAPLFPYSLYDAGPTDPNTGLGPQRWGFFNHFLVSFIDGGYIPTLPASVTPSADGTFETTTIKARAQILYVPSLAYVPTVDANGNYVLAPNDPTIGQLVPPGIGYDVLESKRGDAAYSPLCKVIQYPNPDPDTIARSVDEVVTITNGGALVDLGYVYCLQLAQ